MIKIYKDGESFYRENKDYIEGFSEQALFFRLDKELLKETNNNNYALKVYNDTHILLCLLVEPYSMLILGDKELTKELVDFLIPNNYRLNGYLGLVDVGDSLMNEFNKRNINYKPQIKMEYMECFNNVDVSNENIEIPNEKDVNEIYNMSINFVRDCKLTDEVRLDDIKRTISGYRIIRINNEIVSMVKIALSGLKDKRIAAVYTKDLYRGNGYSKRLVASALNEIIDNGYYATLNVDINNPISYHIYTSLGFKGKFIQGLYYINK